MSKRRTPISFETDAVFERIRRQPLCWDDLAGSRDSAVRRRLRPIVEGLLASGAVKFVRLGGRRLLAVAGWEPTKEQQLQEIYDRCRAVDGCLLWADHIDPQRGPVMYAAWAGTERSVRRRVWGIRRKSLDFSRTVAMTCENAETCVRFEHMELVGRGAKLQGKPKTLAHRRAIALAKRRTAKLDETKVSKILVSEQSGRSIARELDVSQATVQAVRAGDRWRNYRATPFSGLEAANDSGRRCA
jgi:hypothetical protein